MCFTLHLPLVLTTVVISVHQGDDLQTTPCRLPSQGQALYSTVSYWFSCHYCCGKYVIINHYIVFLGVQWLSCKTRVYVFANGLKTARVVKLSLDTFLMGVIAYVWTTCVVCAVGVIRTPCVFCNCLKVHTHTHWKIEDGDTGGFGGRGGWVGS